MTGSGAREIVRRVVGALTVAALLSAAVALGAGLSWPGSSVAGVGVAPARTPMPSAGPATPTESTGGAEVGEPGIFITARPEPDGSFLVSEVITMPRAVTQAVLRPPDVRDAGLGFERLRPAATGLAISAAGQPLAVPDGPLRSEVTFRWVPPSRRLELSYRLTQVSVSSAHAKAGRSLAAIGSLLDEMPAQLPVTTVVTGATVLSLSCPQLPLAGMACGAGEAPRFHTVKPIPFDRSRVLVQYDVPARR